MSDRGRMGWVAVVATIVGCGGSTPLPQPGPDGGATDTGTPDAPAATDVAGVTDSPAATDVGGLCQSIASDYADAVKAAKVCTLGAARQCQVQAQAGFFCDCTTFVNGGADGLAAIVTHYRSSGCTSFCNGTCVQPTTQTCVMDPSSPTGGRCGNSNIFSLTSADQAGTLTVKVGDEIDITLGTVGPGSYSQDPVLSNMNLVVLQVTIPAGPTNPGGPTTLYRLRAVAAGETQVEIPFDAAAGAPTRSSFTVTITVM